MDSFASELGTEFPLRMEAQHIIEPSQVTDSPSFYEDGL